MSGAGMQTSCKETGEKEVQQRVGARHTHKNDVKGDLHENIGKMPDCWGLHTHERGAQRIEDDLERGEEGFARDGVEEEELYT
jgi:hypothetical protein